MVVDKLREIFVPRYNNCRQVSLAGLDSKRANDIVGFNTINHDKRPAQRLDRLKNRGHLGSQVFWH